MSEATSGKDSKGQWKPAAAAVPVLSTLNRDGSRRKIRPKLTRGRFYKRRQALAYSLIALFVALPWISINGKPAVLLDLPRREFTLFGKTFLSTDTVLLMLMLVAIVVTVFLLTALFGRVWCGWACPQNVYMEFAYRPFERLLEGRRSTRKKRSGREQMIRRVSKFAVFFLLSVALSHVFLSYFVGVKTLGNWMTGPPSEHWPAFVVVAVLTALIFADYAWFREQTCIIACPYGRLQSVLLDRQSVIVGYDPGRGEPRMKLKQRKKPDAGPAGDCLDCRACKGACPTGIDIREGLQLECIGCTQCIDACDAMMERAGKPRGLIRYTSQAVLAGESKRLLRPRVIIYPLVLVLVVALLAFAASRKGSADVTLLRAVSTPFVLLDDGQVRNHVRLKVANRSGADRKYQIELLGASDVKVVAPLNPLPVPAGKTRTAVLLLFVPRATFKGGRRPVRFSIQDGAGFEQVIDYRLLGPR